MTLQQSPHHLPSLPQVLVDILDAVHGDELSFQHLADVIHQDPAIAARLLAVANSTSHAPAYRCQTVERALLVLGIDTVKTIVITMAIRQFFNSFGRSHQGYLKAFWRRSLLIASCARMLANLTGYRIPDQAYLCGLLADLGQLSLLQRHGQRYLEQWQTAATDRELLAAEQTAFDETHCQAGAALIRRWQIDPAMAEAVQHHHDDAQLLANAHPLTKIINLSSLLSLPAREIQQAAALLSLSEELIDSLRVRAHEHVAELAQSLDIAIDDPQAQDSQRGYDQLGQRLSQSWELEQARTELDRAGSSDELYQAIQRAAAIMSGVERPLLFLMDSAKQQLQLATPEPALSFLAPGLPLEPACSSISDAFLQQRLVDSSDTDAAAPPAVDRKILSDLDGARLVCVPLAHDGQPHGVLVLTAGGPLPMPPTMLLAFGDEIGSRLAADSTPTEPSAAQLRRQIDEVIHEVSNPLSIIGNYLEMLRLRLEIEQQADENIPLIKEEINRVGDILLRLRSPQYSRHADDPQDLDRLIAQLGRIFDGSLFASRNLRLELRLAAEVPIAATAVGAVKQIVINLVKNAAEALAEGGTVTISTGPAQGADGEALISLAVEDDGPGIPLAVMNQLFSPIASAKGGSHAGLGLSITKRLVDELDGLITCDSGPWGTRFEVLIPS